MALSVESDARARLLKLECEKTHRELAKVLPYAPPPESWQSWGRPSLCRLTGGSLATHSDTPCQRTSRQA